MNYPILLTATIKPQTTYELNLTDSNKRYHQYVDNLIRLITTTNFTQFVFCENSNTWIKHSKMLEELCSYHGKEIEILSFSWDSEKTKQLTRAFWDQEIMEYAVQHSHILAKSEWFYKLTGRYRIKNLNEVIEKRRESKNIFIRWGVGKDTVHTCFFKTTTSYFVEHFMWKADQLPRFENHSLERLYYRYIKQSGINMTIHKTHPIFSGERWAGGMMDESRLKQQKTKLFAQLWLYNIHTTPEVKLKQ